MALAVGMLIDNSVVVLENIYRLASSGMSRRDAVLQGTREVIRAIFASTLTTVCVFLPFLFSTDVIVELFGKQIGTSIVSTLIISMLAALLFIPMVTYQLLGKKNEEKLDLNFEKISIRNRLVQVYILLLKTAMRNPAGTVISAIVAFFVILALSLSTNTNNLKEVETNQLSVYITMPTGSTLELTDQLVASLEQDLLTIEEQEKITSNIEEGTGIVTLNLKKDFQKVKGNDLVKVKQQVKSFMDKYDRRADLDFQQTASNERFSGGGSNRQAQRMERMMGMGTRQERILIKGEDFDLISQVSDDIEEFIEDMDEVSRVGSNLSRRSPEVHLLFDPELMGRKNVTLQNISSELGSFRKEIESGFQYKQGNDEYEIIIRLDTLTEIPPNRMKDLQELGIQSSDGVTYDLQNISRIFYSSGISRINRVNQSKEIELTVRFNNDINESKSLLKAAQNSVDELVTSLNIPSGVAVEVIHEEDDYQEYYTLIAIALLLIFMILASVFESLATPFVLMFSIPLAGIGSLLALLITGNSLLNANTLTGFLILLGVVVNNGIILIDYVNILQKRGYRRTRAIMLAGLARLRPILITAATTIVAMLPLALGNSEYVGAIGAPFAITVIGGLMFSTLLTLVFVPTFYSGLQNTLAWIRGLSWKWKLTHLVVYSLAAYLIYTRVDSFMWQAIDVIVVLIAVPSLTWFVLNSLKQANDTVIDPNEPITIRVQNLVKVYDRESLFSRQWNSGQRLRERFGEAKSYHTLRDLSDLTWQLAILIALVAFAFFYLKSALWKFLITLSIFLLLLLIISPLQRFEKHRVEQGRHPWRLKLWNFARWMIYWFFPLVALILIYLENKNIGGTIILLLLWYLALMVDTLSKKIHRENINVNRLTGKFKNFRKVLYRFVLSIPIIGKKNTPFKALKGVSLEINNGMYGLLGPNGAGKSTLMRAICGINQQSYGTIWFNNINSLEKREELQGLIGYLPQEFGMYENMSAWDYLHYQAILKNINHPVVREDRVTHVLQSVHMWEHRNKKIGSFSGGMKQRVGIAQVLLHLPRILVVDEPTAGLDPRERIRFRNLLVELSRQRIVIFSTHIIEDIASSCEQVAVLRKGEVQYIGSPRNMTETAKGHVWQLTVEASRFEQAIVGLHVIHHLRDGENIRIRIIAVNKPHPDAVEIEPNLEDAYLWLQKVDKK
jgi:ABC-type multidrug transport system ATPase subunit/predicted RND superfamily exporter protein